MYRIIGATSDGKLKIMKQKKLSNDQRWNDLVTEETWESTRFRSYINGSLFYTNEILVPSSWKQYIDSNPSWCIGDVSSSDVTTGSEVLEKEMTNCKEIDNSPIGLMYLSDFYFAYDGKGTTNCRNPACGSWIVYPGGGWTMSRNGRSYAWAVSSFDKAYEHLVSELGAVRPVFYLTKAIQLKEGTRGTIDNPYIIEGVSE